MATNHTIQLQTLHKHTQLLAFIRDSFTFMRFKRHANYKLILMDMAKHADKSRDWSCYRTLKAIAKSVFGVASDSNIRTVKRAIAFFKENGWVEVVLREVRLGKEQAGALWGRNVYRFTDKLLTGLGLQRHESRKALITLKKLWSHINTVLLTKSSRSLECRTW
ncbi:TPA: hypothetical protein JG828_002841 [Vibrio parahaemolyticus]|nr:hypothetical protein [Vibrio parahaemolyticus]